MSADTDRARAYLDEVGRLLTSETSARSGAVRLASERRVFRDHAPRLLEITRALLDLADGWAGRSGGYDARGECAEALRRTVTARLPGSGGGHASP